MRYLGGKSRIAKELARIIVPHIQDTYAEPFIGGLAIAKEIALQVDHPITMYLSDIHPDLILLYQAMQNEWIPPEFVSEEMYKEYRHKEPSALRGFIGFGCSFGGKWYGGYARYQNRNFASESIRNLISCFELFKQHTIIFTHQSYADVQESSVTYCDPPYRNTTEYSMQFNYNIYNSWLLQRKGIVFCSEYTQPYGTIVYEKEKRTEVNKDNRAVFNTERLYKLDNRDPLEEYQRLSQEIQPYESENVLP